MVFDFFDSLIFVTKSKNNKLPTVRQKMSCWNCRTLLQFYRSSLYTVIYTLCLNWSETKIQIHWFTAKWPLFS